MSTIKVIIYILTFVMLMAAAKTLPFTTYTGVKHLGGYVASAGEMNYIIAGILEIIILVIVLFLFFIPLSKKNENNQNIFYLMDSMADSTNELIEHWGNPIIRKEKAFVFLTNLISYVSIIAFYLFLIFNIAREHNGLKAVIILFYTFIFVKIIDIVNDIIRQLDNKSNSTSTPGSREMMGGNNSSNAGMDVLKKKIAIIIILVIILGIFAYNLDSLTSGLYDKLKDIFGFSALDGNRPSIDK